MSVITSHPTCQNGLQPICPPVRSRGNAPSYSVWIQKSHSLTDFIQCNYIIPRHHDKVTKSQDQESWLLRPLKLVWPWARSSCTDLPGSSTLALVKKRLHCEYIANICANIFAVICGYIPNDNLRKDFAYMTAIIRNSQMSGPANAQMCSNSRLVQVATFSSKLRVKCSATAGLVASGRVKYART